MPYVDADHATLGDTTQQWYVIGMIDASPLGKSVVYADQYDPSLLFPIARTLGRSAVFGADDDTLAIPFIGVDVWTAYEVSWLDTTGRPHVAAAQFTIPCVSPFLIESKSLKLYLNSFNQSVFVDRDTVHATLVRDLTTAAGAPVLVELLEISDAHETRAGADFLRYDDAFSRDSRCIDATDVSAITLRYDGPDATYLRIAPYARTAAAHAPLVQETLISHVLKSNCPVTGQPDWATLRIAYRGLPIDHAGLLAYVISYRQHQGFHEQCVEQIFVDLWSHCAPMELSVYARYARRGGLDINPYRASPGTSPLPPRGRCLRQ